MSEHLIAVEADGFEESTARCAVVALVVVPSCHVVVLVSVVDWFWRKHYLKIVINYSDLTLTNLN